MRLKVDAARRAGASTGLRVTSRLLPPEEQEDEAAPSAVAMAIERGRSSGINFATWLWDTSAWITPDKANPRTSGHKISHPIAPLMTAISRAISINAPSC